MIACPGCKRRIIAHREILGASLDGAIVCPTCGQVGRLDGFSRCFVGCMLALLLWMMLLHGDFLFSRYLFLFSMVFILGGWRLLSAAALPLLTLEKAPGTCFDRRQSLVMLVVLVVFAIILDGFMSYRSEADKAYASTASADADTRSK
jgi:hypothetical protein